MSTKDKNTVVTDLGIEVTFMPVPPISRGSSSSKWKGALAAVQSRPGESARIGASVSRGIASYLSEKYGSDFRIETRSVADNKADVFATYIGK